MLQVWEVTNQVCLAGVVWSVVKDTNYTMPLLGGKPLLASSKAYHLVILSHELLV